MAGVYAVIFDVDGVLVDSYDAHFQSWRRLGDERGLVMTEAQFTATFGRTSREIIEELWPEQGFSAQEIQQLDDRKEELYRRVMEEAFTAIDGAAELIDELAAAGFRLAVGSSGPPKNVDLVLRKLARRDLFGGVVTGADVTRGKPDPQVFLLGAEKLNVPPARCAVIEDAPAGVSAAKAAMMQCVGLASSAHAVDKLAHADRVVRSLRELSAAALAELIDGASIGAR